MIPIQYDTANPNVQSALVPYDVFVSHFKKTLRNAAKRGYVGKKRNDAAGNDLTLYIGQEGVKLFKWLEFYLDAIANTKSRYMIRFINAMQTIWHVVPATPLFDCVYHVFIDNGYEGGAFPKDALIMACCTDTCPYCNRNNVGLAFVRKAKAGRIITESVKGQLDHFYYKAKYPYLAISRNNLVPSCKDCNESPNKATEDAVATHLVNPYLISSPDGLLFRIEVPLALSGSRINNSQAKIGINVSNHPAFARNVYTFALQDLYNRFHINEAVTVYNSFTFTRNRNYQSGIDGMTEDLESTKASDYNAFKEACGVVNDKNDYKIILLSKLKTDIWHQLENGL